MISVHLVSSEEIKYTLHLGQMPAPQMHTPSSSQAAAFIMLQLLYETQRMYHLACMICLALCK